MDVSERLNRVAPRTLYLLVLQSPDGYPAMTIGPYTAYECSQVERMLTCEYTRKTVEREVPEWART